MSVDTATRPDVVADTRPEPWRLYDVTVARVERLSPTFLRVTFVGDDLDDFASGGLDQRIKLVLPAAEGGYGHLVRGGDWYTAWRALPEEHRCVLRTYTVRSVRGGIPGLPAEVDVDFALHGETGPAARWALAARPGDQVVVMGPNGRHGGPYGGIEFTPGAGADTFLVVGDETATPAVSAILEHLATRAADGHAVKGEVLLEVPCADDVLDLVVPTGVTLTWVVRDGAPTASASSRSCRPRPPASSTAAAAARSPGGRHRRRAPVGGSRRRRRLAARADRPAVRLARR
ncbi:hypothetical protein GCM10025864_40000 [Luteimicrobium album]|uniref:FAD-binding FR-type domain-containing protein n=1 Tax=Luteimicrobium album TaxID=1054550 RepID=A0ABQ6I6D1_9MICO|nr:hypothetical protein GCM10025864_40000 [Luteimicrobium album]